MFQVAIGHSEMPDTRVAAKEILMQCKESLQGVEPQAGLLFASISYDFQLLLDEIKKVYPDIQLSGCSSFGEISHKFGASEDSAALILFSKDDKIGIYAGMAQNIAKNSHQKLYDGAAKVFEGIKKTPGFCLLFPDGLTTNVTEAIGGLKEYFGRENFPIAGGAASDDWKFVKTYQFYQNQVITESAAFLVFTEPLKSSIAVEHSTDPISQKHRVTSSSKNTVYTVDGKPVLELYKRYLGELQPNFIYGEYPFAIYLNDHSDKFILRAPFSIDTENGSMTFAGDVPENSIIRIAKTNPKENIIDAARRCAQKALKTFSGEKITCAFIFSCAVRKENLGIETNKEIELIKGILPDTPIFGFYSFGEIGQFDSGDPTNFYNHTIVIALIGE